MSIISGRLQGGELLSLVTVDSEVVLGRATQVVADQIRSRKPDLDEFALESITEIFVRLTVSHLLQLRGSRAESVVQIHAVILALFASPPAPPAG